MSSNLLYKTKIHGRNGWHNDQKLTQNVLHCPVPKFTCDDVNSKGFPFLKHCSVLNLLAEIITPFLLFFNFVTLFEITLDMMTKDFVPFIYNSARNVTSLIYKKSFCEKAVFLWKRTLCSSTRPDLTIFNLPFEVVSQTKIEPLRRTMVTCGSCPSVFTNPSSSPFNPTWPSPPRIVNGPLRVFLEQEPSPTKISPFRLMIVTSDETRVPHRNKLPAPSKSLIAPLITTTKFLPDVPNDFADRRTTFPFTVTPSLILKEPLFVTNIFPLIVAFVSIMHDFPFTKTSSFTIFFRVFLQITAACVRRMIAKMNKMQQLWFIV